MTPANTQTKGHPRFAIPLEPATELGLAMLIAEDDDGCYEPVGMAGTINEAKELAQSDLRARMRRLENDEDPGICATVYKLWARGIDGAYRIALEIEDA